MGIQKRIQAHPEGFWELRSTGFATYYVKIDKIERVADKLLYFMELRADQRVYSFQSN